MTVGAVLLLSCLGSRVSRAQSAPAAGSPAGAQGLTPEQRDAQWLAATREAVPARQHWLGVEATTLEAGPYRADWPSLQQHQTPAWFREAKFGIFIHWGVFSVPAFGNEWYSRNMYQPGTPEFQHQRATFGPQNIHGYKDFIPQFTMAHFDPADWATLFQQAGARYVVPVAEHHDGFALYRTELSRWNAVQMGPHRDLVGELAQAVRAKGLRFGVSSHRAEHDWFFDGGRSFASDVNDPRFAGLYGPAQYRELETKDGVALGKDYTFLSQSYRDDWSARSVELVERYHPDLIYFDWWVGFPDFRSTEERFAAFFYDNAAKRQQPVVMTTKNDNMARGAGTLDVERGALEGVQAEPWQTDTSLSNASWGFVEGDTYKTPQMVLDELVDVVSKNGNLLLNIGPRADGTIPEPARETLLRVGEWLRINGEAIYGSRPWQRFGEGPTEIHAGSFQDTKAPQYTAADIRFTERGDVLYAIALRPAAGMDVVVHSLPSAAAPVEGVSLLGYHGAVQWRQDAAGLHVVVPMLPIQGEPVTLRIRLQPMTRQGN